MLLANRLSHEHRRKRRTANGKKEVSYGKGRAFHLRFHEPAYVCTDEAIRMKAIRLVGRDIGSVCRVMLGLTGRRADDHKPIDPPTPVFNPWFFAGLA